MPNKDYYQGLLIRDYLLEITKPLLCGYCNKKLTPATVTLDHINPKSDGHETSIYNAVLACAPCNEKKANSYKEPKRRPPVSIQDFIKFTIRMQKENPRRYWPYKYKATAEYEKKVGRKIAK